MEKDEFLKEHPSLKGKEVLVKSNPLFPELMVRSGDIHETQIDKKKLEKVIVEQIRNLKNSALVKNKYEAATELRVLAEKLNIKLELTLEELGLTR